MSSLIVAAITPIAIIAINSRKKSLGERVVLQRRAKGNPFDNGEFVLMEEAIDAPWLNNDPLHFTADKAMYVIILHKNIKIEKIKNKIERAIVNKL